MTDDEEAMQDNRIRVLVVDDESAICKALATALERAGYKALTANSGDNALALLAEHHVDVMLIDLRIPDTRGDIVFELAAATHPHLRHQTLFMTGDLSERAQKLIASCACDALKKPFELKDMIRAVLALAPRAVRSSQEQSA